MHSRMGGLISLLFFAGCGSAPVPQVKEQWNESTNTMQREMENGYEYCRRVATNSDVRSQWYLGTGIGLSILAASLVVAGTAMGPDTDSGASWVEENRNSLIISGGGLVAIPATVFLMLTKNSTRTSAAAALGMMAADDASALKTCLQARNSLVNARLDIADYVKDTYQERIDSLQQVKEERLATAKQNLAEAETADDDLKEKLETSAKKARFDALILDDMISKEIKKAKDAAIQVEDTPPPEENNTQTEGPPQP
jgi:hypothetical protein